MPTNGRADQDSEVALSPIIYLVALHLFFSLSLELSQQVDQHLLKDSLLSLGSVVLFH